MHSGLDLRPRSFDVLMHLQGDRLASIALILAFTIAALGAGYIIGTGSIVATALVSGAIMSAVLLSFPAVAVWMILVGVLLVSGPLSFNLAGVEKISWLFSVLGIFLLVASGLYGSLSRERRPVEVPPFIWMLIAFVLLGIASAFWSNDPASFAFQGMKRYFQYTGVMLALVFIPFQPRTVWRWMLFILILSAIQLPYVAWQRFVIVPSTGWTLDAVVGTMEATRTGWGSSGSLAFMSTCVFAGLMASLREGMIGKTRFGILSLLVLAPLFLADVNVVWLMLPMAFVVVFADLVRRRPMMFVMALVGGLMAVALVAASLVLFQKEKTTERADQSLTFSQDIERLLLYNFGAMGYLGPQDVNRTTVYKFWWEENYRLGLPRLMFGHGIGSVSDVGDSGPRSALRAKYGAMSLGLSVGALLLWETGLIGFLIYMIAMFSAWFFLGKLPSRAPPGRLRVLARTMLVAHSCNMLYVFYTANILWVATQNLLTALVLGVGVWTHRQIVLGARQTRSSRQSEV